MVTVAPELQSAVAVGAVNALRSRPPSLESFLRRLVGGTLEALVQAETVEAEPARVDHSQDPDVIDAEFEVIR